MKPLIFLSMLYLMFSCSRDWNSPFDPKRNGNPLPLNYTYSTDFVWTADKLWASPHGVVVTPDEKIWIGFFGYSDVVASDSICPLWIYNPDGTLYRKIISLTYQGKTETIYGSCRGLSLDNNGNVLFSEHDKLWRINYQTYEAMNKVIPVNDFHLTEAACDKNGFIYITHVLPNGKPLYIYDKNFVLYGRVDQSVQTTQRSIVASPDGKDVYLGRINGANGSNGIIHYHSDTGPKGTYVAIDTFQTRIWAHCLDWDRNGFLWVGSHWNVGINDSSGWYALDPAKNWEIIGSIGRNFGSYTDAIRIPPGETYYAPRGAAWSLDGSIMYTADINGHVVKKWNLKP